MAPVASVPAASTPCASASASRHGTPRRLNCSSTYVFPVAMPPVRATFSTGGLTGPSCPPSRGRQRVLQEHGDRQGPDAARDRRQPAGNVRHFRMHVADDDRATALERLPPLRTRLIELPNRFRQIG